MIVSVKETPIRHNGTVYRAGDEFEINKAGYDRLEPYVDVVEDDEEAEVAIEDMTGAQLKAYAKSNNIDLGEATRKPDILAKIQEAQGGGAGGNQS